jgi:hypothetical protein
MTPAASTPHRRERTQYDHPMKFPAKRPPGYERCGRCGALVRVVGRDDVPLGFEKHRIPSIPDWCANGTQPAAKPKNVKRAHRGKSVRTVSGGLPGLGKDT